MTRRSLMIAAALTLVCAACSSPSAPRDDRATVRADVQSFGATLVQLGYIANAPEVYIGDCQSGKWAAVKWSAPLTTKLGQEHPDRAEAEVLDNAIAKIKLDELRSIQVSDDTDPAQIVQTTDHATVLTITVPKAEYVRVDGYASC
jgi:GTPase